MALRREVAEQKLDRLRGALAQQGSEDELAAAVAEVADMSGELRGQFERLREELAFFVGEIPNREDEATRLVLLLDSLLPGLRVAESGLQGVAKLAPRAPAGLRAQLAASIDDLGSSVIRALEVGQELESKQLPELRTAAAELLEAVREQLWSDPGFRAEVTEGLAAHERGDVIELDDALSQLGES